MTNEQIVKVVRECVAEAIDADVEEVQADHCIVKDLGADSIDLLDLLFQLEQKFNIRISPRGIEKQAQLELGETPLEIDGVYTEEALVKLREALPEISNDELGLGLRTDELPRLFRVRTFVNLVTALKEQQNA
jgi:acyl carrier protein